MTPFFAAAAAQLRQRQQAGQRATQTDHHEPAQREQLDGRGGARDEYGFRRVPRDVGRGARRVHELRDAVREQPDGKETFLVHVASDIRNVPVRIVVLISTAVKSLRDA